ncbi:MAG: aldose 1-epimerase family protein [Bacteroidota bacterium]
MQYIKSHLLQVGVQSTGAELSSIRSLQTQQEYMWDAQPAIWGNHAPVLFPIVGGLKNGEYIHDGQTYPLPRHGFIRYNTQVELRAQTESKLTYGLSNNLDTEKVYPFKFDFVVHFELFDNKLTISHEVHNRDEKEMYFSLGAHPAFKCPLHEDETYADYYLEFAEVETEKTWLLDRNGLIETEGPLMLDHTKVLPLTPNMFDNDALIFKTMRSRRVSLKSHKSEQILTVHYEGWPYLGIWSKPKAPFVCIEPWLGIADHADTDQQLSTKFGILSLAPGQSFEAQYTIEITE